jgi:primase-polymerase (primpol)-like protein
VTAPIAENIPEALKQGKRFVGWRYEDRGAEKPAKVPYAPDAPKGASSTAPADWTTFDRAVRYAQVAGLDGVMRAFDHADGMVGMDLDDCLDPTIPEPTIDDLAPQAADFVRRLDTYCEISPSGAGVKLWVKGTMPAFGHHRGDVEMYGSVVGRTGPCGRFFTMTGRRLKGTPATVGYRPDVIAAIHRAVFGEAPDPVSAGADRDGPIPALELGDEDVLRLASTSPHNGERFRRLWSGDTSDYARDGNDGESEADCALCELLFFYGGPDEDRADRLFRRSGLYRDKWERADYRASTFARALRGKTRFYGDASQPPAPAPACACSCCDHGSGPETDRLRRYALDADDLIEYQQAIIRAERTAKDAAVETVRRISDVLAIPSKQLAPASKLVTIATVLEAHSRGSRGQVKLPLDALVERTGLSRNAVSARVQDLAAREGSPIERRVTREWVTTDDGVQQPISVSLVSPKHASVNESLTAVLTMGGPSQKAQRRAEAAKARAARWGRCTTHDNDLVAIKGFCPEGGEIVGERVLRVEEFDALNPIVCDSRPPPPRG